MVPAVSFSEVAGSLVLEDGLPGGVSDTCDTFSPSSARGVDFSSYGGNWWYESINPLLIVLFWESVALVTSAKYCL